MNPFLPVLVSLFVGVLAYVGGRADGRRLEAAEYDRAQLAATSVKDEVMDRVAKEISKLQVVNKTIVQRTERETIREPVYSECVNTPDGLRFINEAITGIQSRPGSSDKLSGTGAP